MLKTEHIYEGHVLDVLRSWPDESVHLIVTSPPYWQLRDYGGFDIIWGGDSTCSHEWQDVVYPKARGSRGKDGWKRPSRSNNPTNEPQTTQVCAKCGAWYGALGLEPSFKDYIGHLKLIFAECKRVLADFGSIYVNLGDTFYGSGSGHVNGGKQNNIVQAGAFPAVRVSDKTTLKGGCQKLKRTPMARGTQLRELPSKCMTLIPERFVIMMVDELGFIARSKPIWWKRNAIPESQRDRFTIDYENIYFFSKKPRYWHELQVEPIQEETKKRVNMPAVGGKKYTGQLPEYEKFEKFSGLEVIRYDTRTVRSVWDIPTDSFEGAHFATFPPALVHRIISASCPKEVCSNCGMPKFPVYRKVTTKEGIFQRFVSWKQGCKCVNPTFQSGIVADIFAGSGTSLAMAKTLDRRWVGIEINPDYIQMAYDRIDVDQTSLLDFMKEEDDGNGKLDDYF